MSRKQTDREYLQSRGWRIVRQFKRGCFRVVEWADPRTLVFGTGAR